jgi:membrane-associated phospholipid phosphatase
MLDNMTLQEDNENPTTTKPLYVQFARLLSTLLSPALIALPFVILVALYQTRGGNAWLSAAIAFFFLSVGPMLYIFYGVSTGKFTDVDVSVRSQRTGPFIIFIAFSLLGFAVLEHIHGQKTLEIVLLMAVLTGTIMMLTTFWWKISIHTSTLSAAVTMLSVLYGKIVLPAYLLVIMVSWSRVILRRHTLAQVVAGSIIGVLLTLVLLKTQGY